MQNSIRFVFIMLYLFQMYRGGYIAQTVIYFNVKWPKKREDIHEQAYRILTSKIWPILSEKKTTQPFDSNIHF